MEAHDGVMRAHPRAEGSQLRRRGFTLCRPLPVALHHLDEDPEPYKKTDPDPHRSESWIRILIKGMGIRTTARKCQPAFFPFIYSFVYFFGWARVCWPLLCLCRPFLCPGSLPL
jgi:hypothetical protein